MRPPSRWRTLAAAVVCESVAGTAYAYSLYKPALRTRFGLHEHDVDLLGTILNMGQMFGAHVGVFFNVFGPRTTLWLGMLLNIPANVALWLLMRVDNASGSVPFWLLGLLVYLQGHSQLIVDIAAVSTLAPAFPEHRGRALGIAKSFVGLSGSLVACVYIGVFAPDATDLLLYLAGSFLVCNLFGVCFLRPPPPGRVLDPTAAMPRRRLRGATVGTLTLTLALVGGSLLDLTLSNAALNAAAVCAATAIFGALVAYLCATPRTDEGHPADADAAAHIQGATTLTLHRERLLPAATTTTSPRAAAESARSAAEEATEPPEAGAAPPPTDEAEAAVAGRSLLRALVSVEAGLLFAIMTLGPGSGLLLINNLDSLHAAKAAAGDPSVLVSLVSTCNAAGRVLAGTLSDSALHAAGVPRPHALGVAYAIMALALLALLLEGTWPLYAAAAGCGLAYGAFNSLYPACVSEIFGLGRMPVVYSTLSCALALGSWLYATSLYSSVYAAALRRHPAPDGVCVGTDCFAASALVAAASCGVGIFLSAALGLYTRARYRSLSAGRRRAAAANARSEGCGAAESVHGGAMPVAGGGEPADAQRA